MDPGMIIGIIGICILLLINIAVAAYGYGKLTQKVKGMDCRLEKVEVTLNGYLTMSNPGKKKSRKVKK